MTQILAQLIFACRTCGNPNGSCDHVPFYVPARLPLPDGMEKKMGLMTKGEAAALAWGEFEKNIEGLFP